MRRALRGDEGVAMIFVIAVGLVVSILVVAMFGSVLQNSTNSRSHRNVTSAQAAAEAGISDAFFKLSQNDPGTGKTYWSEFAGCPQSLPCTQSVGTNASYKMWVTNETVGGNPTGHLIIWSQGKFGANTRTIRETVQQTYPPAFDYSMFASKGIDIHHHGSSYLSPQVTTTSIHSNGYIKLDYSSEYTVNTMEAVTSITFAAGGGSTPGGNILDTGYSWYDPLNSRCYPGGTSGTSQSSCTVKYSGNSLVTGSVEAASVSMPLRGQINKLMTPQQVGTQTIDGGPYNGGILAGSFSSYNQTYTGTNSIPTITSCAVCDQGDPNTGVSGDGKVAGHLWLEKNYAPPVIPFPSIDFSTKYRPISTTYSSASDFLTYVDKTTSNYRCFNGTSTLGACATGAWPDAIELPPAYYDITSGSLTLKASSVQSDVASALGVRTYGAVPVIIVRGGIIVENGGITLNSGLVMVGKDQTGGSDNILLPPSGKDPISVNVASGSGAFLDSSANLPAILAAGGSINSSDYDTDSSWTATCNCYEPNKATPIYIRGLVYSASWNGTTSVPQNQHWHNYDPKNLMKIYGSQVGADLHDCNNFTFTYDPIVRNAFGFGGGSVKVVDYQELGS